MLRAPIDLFRESLAVGALSERMDQIELGRLVVLVRVGALVVRDEWQGRDRAAARHETMHRDHATRVATAGRRVDPHDHEQVHAREVVPVDAKLADELGERLVARIGVERRSERVTASQRLEDAHRLRAPQIDGQV